MTIQDKVEMFLRDAKRDYKRYFEELSRHSCSCDSNNMQDAMEDEHKRVMWNLEAIEYLQKNFK